MQQEQTTKPVPIEDVINNSDKDLLKILSEKICLAKLENTDLNTRVKANNKAIDKWHWEIMKIMDDLGMEEDDEKITTAFGSHKRETELYSTFDDETGGFNQFVKWAVKSQAWEFLRKQINVTPFRAFVIKNGFTPPGLGHGTKAKIKSTVSTTFRNKMKEEKSK